MLKCTALLLLATVPAGAVAAQDGAPSIRPVLELIGFTNAQFQYCPSAVAPDDSQQVVSAAISALAASLEVRAQALGKKPEDIPKGVADYIALITREPPNLSDFQSVCPPDLTEPINLLRSAGFQAYLEDYRSFPVTYDKPFAIPGTDVETFADEQTQQNLLATISSQMADCPEPRIGAISLESRLVGPEDSVPIFVAPNIIYSEIWVAECGDQRERLINAFGCAELTV
jgi:hypothetical protein